MGTKRVQHVVLEGLKELPVQFIRPADERPENTKAKEGVQVPVVSLIQSRENLVRDITKACSDWGFFLLTDHGVSPLLIQRLQAVGEEFFSLPQEEKERYANDPVSGKLEGYGTKMTKNHEQKLEWIDYYFHLMSPPSRVDYQTWPKNPHSPSYKEVTEEYTKEVLQDYRVSLGEDKIEYHHLI